MPFRPRPTITPLVLVVGLTLVQTSREAYATSDSDRLTTLEQQLAVMQREVSNIETRAQQQSAPKSAPAASTSSASTQPPSSNGLSWALADSVFGVDRGAVRVSGNDYTIDRAWLGAELALQRLPGHAPVLAPVPAGVAFRAVKPKSLAAKLGFQNADVIVAIDDKPVHSAADISAALHAATGNQTKVRLIRKKVENELTYRLDG